MTREIIFGVSLPIILPIFFGLDGLLWSFPAADLLTFIIAIFFIRQTYHRFYTNMKWGHAQNYHLTLDSGVLGIEKCVALICEVYH